MTAIEITEITVTDASIDEDGSAFVVIAPDIEPPYARHEMRTVRVERMQLTDQEADEPGEEDAWNPWRVGQWVLVTSHERDIVQAGSIMSTDHPRDADGREVEATDERPSDGRLLAEARDRAAEIAETWRRQAAEDAADAAWLDTEDDR